MSRGSSTVTDLMMKAVKSQIQRAKNAASPLVHVFRHSQFTTALSTEWHILITHTCRVLLEFHSKQPFTFSTNYLHTFDCWKLVGDFLHCDLKDNNSAQQTFLHLVKLWRKGQQRRYRTLVGRKGPFTGDASLYSSCDGVNPSRPCICT